MSNATILREVDTEGWYFKIGDVFSNPYEYTHFKVSSIHLKDGDDAEDARIYGYRVDPNDYSQKLDDSDVADEEFHRAWYFNESWFLEAEG